MSAEFEDLGARIQRLAMDEFRAKHRDTYPTAEAIAEARAALLVRLWSAVTGGRAGGPYVAPFAAPYYVMDLPDWVECDGAEPPAFRHRRYEQSRGAPLFLPVHTVVVSPPEGHCVDLVAECRKRGEAGAAEFIRRKNDGEQPSLIEAAKNVEQMSVGYWFDAALRAPDDAKAMHAAIAAHNKPGRTNE